MKILSIVAFSFLITASAQAETRPVQKLLCEATGAVKNIMTLIVTPTDLTGQICAISVDQNKNSNFYASNDSIESGNILVSEGPSNTGSGISTVRLLQETNAKGEKKYTLVGLWRSSQSSKDSRTVEQDDSITCKVVTE